MIDFFLVIIGVFFVIIILDDERAAHVSLEICCTDQLPSMPLTLSFLSPPTYLSTSLILRHHYTTRLFR